jgi:hypothetical protein
VSEVERLPHGLQDAPADEVLDALRRFGRAQLRRVAQDGEVELPADDAGDAGESASPVREPLQPPGDHRADGLRDDDVLRTCRRVTPLEHANRLDHHERISCTHAPDGLGDPRHHRLFPARPHKRPDQGHRLAFGQRRERQRQRA